MYLNIIYLFIQQILPIIKSQINFQAMGFADGFFAFFNGMVAGWSQVFVMQPFEIIKVRLQTQPKDAKIYNGIIDCLTKIIKNEGPLALYKGTLTPLMGVGILGSVRFGLFQNFKNKLAQYQGIAPINLDIPSRSLCAFATGFLNSFLMSPIQHTRIRVQIQKSAAQKIYTGSLDAFIKILREHGIKGLYRGIGPSLVRQATGLTFYFTTIEKITEMLSPPGITNKKDLPFYVPFLAGGIGGTSYWIFNYPFDYVKTLMQSDKFGNFRYQNMWDCFRQQYQQNGWRTFYKGYLICLMRSFPVNAAAMVTYRIMQKLSNVNAS